MMDGNALYAPQWQWDQLNALAPRRQEYGGVLDQLGIVPPQQDTPDRNGFMDRVGQGFALADHYAMGIPTTVAGLVNSAIPGQPFGDMWSIKDNAETARNDLSRGALGRDLLALPEAFGGMVPGGVGHSAVPGNARALADTTAAGARQAGRLAESAIDPVYNAMPSNVVGSAGGKLTPPRRPTLADFEAQQAAAFDAARNDPAFGNRLAGMQPIDLMREIDRLANKKPGVLNGLFGSGGEYESARMHQQAIEAARRPPAGLYDKFGRISEANQVPTSGPISTRVYDKNNFREDGSSVDIMRGGVKIAEAKVKMSEPETLSIDWIETVDGHRLSISDVRAAQNSIRDEFPGVTKIDGSRVSGAKARAFGDDETKIMQSVPIRNALAPRRP